MRQQGTAAAFKALTLKRGEVGQLAADPELPRSLRLLPRLTMPVTLMAGALDDKFLGLAGELARALPHATLRAAPGAGHDLLLERPDLVAVELRS
jgi:pimeloyl-ACP methyl ester carboxylesterase